MSLIFDQNVFSTFSVGSMLPLLSHSLHSEVAQLPAGPSAVPNVSPGVEVQSLVYTAHVFSVSCWKHGKRFPFLVVRNGSNVCGQRYQCPLCPALQGSSDKLQPHRFSSAACCDWKQIGAGISLHAVICVAYSNLEQYADALELCFCFFFVSWGQLLVLHDILLLMCISVFHHSTDFN